MPALSETFAGNSWRVEERPERGASQRFVILGSAPGTFGAEVEICAVQYRPHAEAIAALPDLAPIVEYACSHDGNPELDDVGRRLVEELIGFAGKAEGRGR